MEDHTIKKDSDQTNAQHTGYLGATIGPDG